MRKSQALTGRRPPGPPIAGSAPAPKVKGQGQRSRSYVTEKCNHHITYSDQIYVNLWSAVLEICLSKNTKISYKVKRQGHMSPKSQHVSRLPSHIFLPKLQQFLISSFSVVFLHEQTDTQPANSTSCAQIILTSTTEDIKRCLESLTNEHLTDSPPHCRNVTTHQRLSLWHRAVTILFCRREQKCAS